MEEDWHPASLDASFAASLDDSCAAVILAGTTLPPSEATVGRFPSVQLLHSYRITTAPLEGDLGLSRL